MVTPKCVEHQKRTRLEGRSNRVFDLPSRADLRAIQKVKSQLDSEVGSKNMCPTRCYSNAKTPYEATVLGFECVNQAS